ncbi:glutamyl-tRNA(Gln) amidotransferase subunit D, partial [mine drainage metagenome]
MFDGLTGPVVMVGSQRSSDRPSSDSFGNMEGALAFGATDVGEVCISMHSGTSDDNINLLRGTRTRKMHSTRRDAFRTISGKPLATFTNGKTEMVSEYEKTRKDMSLTNKLENRVSIVYFHPGFIPKDIENISEDKKAIIIMGTGLGHIAKDTFPSLKRIIKNGTKVVMASQCISGRVDLDVYSTGRELKKIGIISAENMLPEVALTKSMFLLANYPEEEFETMMKRNMRGEIVERGI